MGNGGPSARADDPIYGLIQGSPMCGDIARLAVAQVFVEHHLHILAMPLVDQEAGKVGTADQGRVGRIRSEEQTSELQSLMRISYAVFCLQTKTNHKQKPP